MTQNPTVVQGLSFDPNDLWRYLFQAQQPTGMPEGRDIDISSLPAELRQIIDQRRSDFSEGDQDKIDTENEFRKLMEGVLGLDRNNPNLPGMDALQNLS